MTVAAHLLESAQTDLEFRDGDGDVGVRGVPDLNVALRQICLAPRSGWDGQLKGGLDQGMEGGLLQDIVHDENTQLPAGSFMDDRVTSASEVPPIRVLHEETPSPLNPLGVQGLTECGVVAPPVVIANPVADALKQLGAAFNSTPIGWEDVMRVFPDEAAPASGPG